MKTVVGTTQTVVRYATLVMKWLDAAKILALILLVIYLPALMGIALIVCLTSKGPAFINRAYRRPNGQMVDLWEFRTECWERWEPTRIGAYLQRTNMHRLPAIVNVLRGDVEPGERVKSTHAW